MTVTAQQLQEFYGLSDHEVQQVELLHDKMLASRSVVRQLEALEKRLGNDTAPIIEACVYEALRTDSIVDRLGALTRESPELWKELFG
jgi:hypothetical protein